MASGAESSDGEFLRRVDGILHDFMEQCLSSHEAAGSIASALGTDVADVTDRLYGVWEAIIDLARESHETHIRLVELLQQFRCLPLHLDGDGEPVHVYGRRVWSDLPGFGLQMYYEWEEFSISFQPARLEQEEKITAFRYINRFMGHLSLTDSKALDFSNFAIWTMRDALETPKAKVPNGVPIDVWLQAAAEWIFVSGLQMYQWRKVFPKGPIEGNPGAGGPLWTGESAFCKERWTLWKERFAYFSTSTEVSHSVQQLAQQCNEKMLAIESTIDT